MVSINNSFHGEVMGSKIEDLLSTMLSLVGYDMPADLHRKFLVAEALLTSENTDLSEDKEALLRERLSGLEFIG